MAISSFIPKVWSARLQENFHKALVFGSLCSRNYEGEISQWGDTVHISNLSDITVRPTTRRRTSPSRKPSAAQTLC